MPPPPSLPYPNLLLLHPLLMPLVPGEGLQVSSAQAAVLGGGPLLLLLHLHQQVSWPVEAIRLPTSLVHYNEACTAGKHEGVLSKAPCGGFCQSEEHMTHAPLCSGTHWLTYCVPNCIFIPHFSPYGDPKQPRENKIAREVRKAHRQASLLQESSWSVAFLRGYVCVC